MTGSTVGWAVPRQEPTGEVAIRQAVGVDLPSLVRALGQPEFFADRLARQRRGRGVLFTAWLDSEPIGDVYLWLEPAEEPEIRTHLPGVPLLTHLEVLPCHRNRGVGTKLIEAIENHLLAHGFDRVALAVELTNDSAARLYHRLGFFDWGHSEVLCYHFERVPEGGWKQCSASCQVLVKTLARTS